MACNGFNHRENCTCNFRGGHPNTRPPIWRAWKKPNIRRLQERPNAKCPECRANVYYLSFPSGGCAYFDKLGPPWPKHPCTDDAKKYSPYTRSGKPRLTVKPTEFEEAGWLPFVLRKIGEYSIGTIIYGVALDSPTVLHFGTRDNNLGVDRDMPIHFRLRNDDGKRVDIDYFPKGADRSISICMFTNCRNEIELLANCNQ